MSSPDDFDPTHALDGWRVPAPAPVDLQLASLRPARALPGGAVLHRGTVVAEPDAFEPTRALDGWHAPSAAPLDLELRSLLRTKAAQPDEAKKAWLKKRGYEMVDVEDIDVPDMPRRWAVVDAPLDPIAAAAAELARMLDEAPLPDVPVMAQQAPALVPVMEDLVPPESPTAAPPSAEAEMAPELDLSAPPSPSVPDPEQLTASIELPDVPPPPATIDAPPLDFRVAPPAVPDAQQLLDDVALPDVPPPPVDVEAPPLEMPVSAQEPSAPLPVMEELAPPESPPEPPPIEDLPTPPPPAEAEMAFELDFSAPPPPATIDTPTLDFRAAPPAVLDAQQLLDDITLPDVPPPPAAVEAPVLDLPAPAAPAEPDPRLLAQWRPQAWVAQVRRIAEAGVEVQQGAQGLRVENLSPQWLCALWPPLGDAPLLARWPDLATVVGADTADAALHLLLPELPAQAELWRADKRDADWALLADLVLHQHTGLTAGQTRGLRALAEAERGANLRHMSHDYLTEGRLARRRA